MNFIKTPFEVQLEFALHALGYDLGQPKYCDEIIKKEPAAAPKQDNISADDMYKTRVTKTQIPANESVEDVFLRRRVFEDSEVCIKHVLFIEGLRSQFTNLSHDELDGIVQEAIEKKHAFEELTVQMRSYARLNDKCIGLHGKYMSLEQVTQDPTNYDSKKIITIFARVKDYYCIDILDEKPVEISEKYDPKKMTTIVAQALLQAVNKQNAA